MKDTPSEESQRLPVVCADVDGTLLATDLLYESLVFALKRRWWVILLVPLWLLRGRAFLKERLAERSIGLDVDTLPIHAEVVAYLEMAAREGRRVLLVSASSRVLVERLAKRFSFIDGVIASDGAVNCKGKTKARLIQQVLGGDACWEYVGDTDADFAVWREATSVVCVSSSRRFTARVVKEFPAAVVLSGGAHSPSTWLAALRVHQWAKNILVFVPLLLAHQWHNPSAWSSAFGAAVSLSLCASGVYVLNDLLDLDADRRHLRKRNRPFASGDLPLEKGLLIIPVLFCAAFCLSLYTSLDFSFVLALYLVMTTAYSYRLKALALVDILLLAILYTLRIIAGGVASSITVSQWLICLAMFLFLSLACVKRFSELLLLQAQNEKRTYGRGYAVGDLEQIASFGSASGYIAALVMALYVSSKEIAVLYAHPTVVWLAVPLLLYWISRMWLLARRGLVHDDPLVFALKDKVTYAVGLLVAVIFVGAKW